MNFHQFDLVQEVVIVKDVDLAEVVGSVVAGLHELLLVAVLLLCVLHQVVHQAVAGGVC